MVLREHYDEGGSFTQLTFDLNVSPVEFDNFLNEGETDPQPPGIPKGFCFFLEVAREYFFERLMGNSDPCIGNAGKDEFGVLIKADTNFPSLTIILDGIREEIIKELVEFILDPGDLHWFRGKLGLQLNLLLPCEGFDG
jgi:hypothetical protein